MKNRTKRRVAYKNDNSGFLTFGVISPFVFKFDFVSAQLLEYPSQYFDGTLKKCRTGRDDMLPTRMTTVAGLGGAFFLFIYFF